MTFKEGISNAVVSKLLDPVLRANYLSAGEMFWVFEDSDTGLQKMQKDHPKNTFVTVAEANTAVTTNRNDIIFLGGYSSHSNALVTVSKNRVHFIGLDGGGRKNSQGSKMITPATSVAATVAVVSNTGTRNTYKNIKFIQNGTNAAQTSAFIDTGEGTYVKNCSFHHNSLLSTANTQALLFKGDTCHYEDCQIGNSTVYHTVANQAPLVIKTPARYTYFINCTIIQYSSQTTASCIDVPDADGIIGWIKFENVSLMNANLGDGATAGGAMAEAVTSVCTSGYLYFDNRCTSYRAVIFAELDSSIMNAAPAGAATAGGGEAVAGA
ncbi:hypothetical protein LCGC14_0828590 [marine sediment metagenome]|uniref:Right handed beta helix domain-containing protein n=1 Tax=marine sediment metagenome TaxID=412755 RepID=A0A0F9PGL1_9ZZZZ